jgi:hypothetical protein
MADLRGMMMEVAGMVDTDVTCVVGEEPDWEEVVRNWVPAQCLEGRIGSNCYKGFRWLNLMIGIVKHVETSWDHRVEEEVDW